MSQQPTAPSIATYSYQLCFKDYDEAHGRIKRAGDSRHRFVMWLLAGLFVLLTVVSFSLRPDPSNQPHSLVEFLPWFGIFVVVWIVIFRLLRSRVRREWEEQTVLHSPKNATFRDDGIAIVDAARQLNYHWTSVPRFAETRNLFILYTADDSFHIIPKRIFSTDEQVSQFRQYLEARIGGRHLILGQAIPGQP